MIDKLRAVLGKHLWKTEHQEGLETPVDQYYHFILSYNKLIIGELVLDKGIWKFSYADEFKQQTKIKPLPEFADINKVYESPELFPFFLHRIPSLSQPKVKRVVAQENLDKENEAALLKRFGRVSVSNPFQLSIQ